MEPPQHRPNGEPVRPAFCPHHLAGEARDAMSEAVVGPYLAHQALNWEELRGMMADNQW